MTSYSLVDSCWHFREYTSSSDLGGGSVYLRNIDKQTLYDVTQQTVHDVTQQTLYDVTQQTLYDVTQQTLYDVTQQTVYDVTQQTVYDVTQQTVYDVTQQTVYDVTQQKASVNICCCEKLASNTRILSTTYILFNQRHPVAFQLSQ